jgi:inhibitor of KinA
MLIHQLAEDRWIHYEKDADNLPLSHEIWKIVEGGAPSLNIQALRFEPLGDQAVMAYWPDENAAGRFADEVRNARFPWVIDVVQAYTAVAIYYDLGVVDFRQAEKQLRRLESETPADAPPARLVKIPCCYELGLDWPLVERHTGLRAPEIIRLHSGTIYTVYAIGFCPGFPYLGYLPEKIAGVPRLPAPRLKVAAGSVGLTGRQTGIYAEERPGGWNIVGRTPLELVNVKGGYFPLRTGDRVQFTRIDEKAFRKLEGERLPDAGSPVAPIHGERGT